jgi:hypothetical protein
VWAPVSTLLPQLKDLADNSQIAARDSPMIIDLVAAAPPARRVDAALRRCCSI